MEMFAEMYGLVKGNEFLKRYKNEIIFLYIFAQVIIELKH